MSFGEREEVAVVQALRRREAQARREARALGRGGPEADLHIHEPARTLDAENAESRFRKRCDEPRFRPTFHRKTAVKGRRESGGSFGLFFILKLKPCATARCEHATDFVEVTESRPSIDVNQAKKRHDEIDALGRHAREAAAVGLDDPHVIRARDASLRDRDHLA